MSVLTSIGPSITDCARFLHFIRNSTCSLSLSSSSLHLVWLLVFASIARVSKSCPNSLSFSFVASTTVVDPSWLMWTISTCDWWSLFFLSLFLLCLCCSACCCTCAPVRVRFFSGWFFGSGLSGCWSAMVSGTSGWVYWMSSAAGCVSGGFWE